jgi:hypothetical protein
MVDSSLRVRSLIGHEFFFRRKPLHTFPDHASIEGDPNVIVLTPDAMTQPFEMIRLDQQHEGLRQLDPARHIEASAARRDVAHCALDAAAAAMKGKPAALENAMSGVRSSLDRILTHGFALRVPILKACELSSSQLQIDKD